MDKELLNEARQLINQIKQDFSSITNQIITREADHELLNQLHRNAHSLKGISGLGGLNQINQLATMLQDIFDALRKKRLVLQDSFIDILSEVISAIVISLSRKNVDLLGQIEKCTDWLDLLNGILSATQKQDNAGQKALNFLTSVGLSNEISLTEYEECRLAQHLLQNSAFYLIVAEFALTDFDIKLQAFQQKIKDQGEQIALIPGQGDDLTRMQFKFLLAGSFCLGAVQKHFLAEDVQIIVLQEPQADDVFIDDDIAF